MGSKEARNHAADFFRYIFSFIVLVMHFRYYGNFEGERGQFNGGYLAVEFFFILGGYFLARQAEKDRAGERGALVRTAGYLVSRIKRILPAYWFSLGALLIANLALGHGWGYARDFFTKGLPEIFLLQVFYHPHEIVLYNWYLSAMLWAGAAVYLAAAAMGRWFYRAVCPGAIILGYGYLAAASGHADVTAYAPALIRAAAGMCMGCGIYRLRMTAAEKGYVPGRAVVTAAEAISATAAFIIMYFNRHTLWDFAGIFCMGVLVWALFAERGLIFRALNRKALGYPGGLSLTIYLSQAMAQNIFNRFFWGAFPFWAAAVILYAGMTLWAVIIKETRRAFRRKRT